MKYAECVETPWDAEAFGMATYEIADPGPEALRRALERPGHYTARIDPLASKAALHEAGFYYCDTLIEPHCGRGEFVRHDDPGAAAVPARDFESLRHFVPGAFRGRFHRDFRLDPLAADRRYERWLHERWREGNVFELRYKDAAAGFFAFSGSRIELHALGEPFRGKRLAKYLWSAAIQELFARGHGEITSSISASHAAALNLYTSLGFRFRRPLDVYHLLVKEGRPHAG